LPARPARLSSAIRASSVKLVNDAKKGPRDAAPAI
jgi:hypothetical protein